MFGGGGGWGNSGGNRGGSGWGNSGGNRGNSGWGSSWSVPEEITRGSVPQTTTVQSPGQLVQSARAANDGAVFWTNYFAQDNVDHALIHDVVRQLSIAMRTNRQNADQVIALTEAAILSGNAQPWMYEALTLSLYLTGAPTAQVLRAALSAADFCQDPIDLLNVGFVMRELLDLEQYVFPLYQQALVNMPPQREIYAATLRLGWELFNKYDEEEPLRWISLAIVSQEWDGMLGERLSKDANDALETLTGRLRRQGRTEEAQQLAQDIREAKLRDFIVTIEWTGDAGIDLIVREPSNSLCWFRNPRSASGGLLKTAPLENPARISSLSSTRKVSYVVPQGFNGKYELIVNKSWGTLTNDLIKVNVQTNTVPGEGKSEGTTVRMEPKGVVFDFTLETGRRTESVSEIELAVADTHMAVAQQITDRNAALWRLMDDGLLGQVADPTPTPTPTPVTPTAPINIVPVSNPSITDYLFGSRYIGYAPQIEIVTQGVTFDSPMIAVSPDRRYVLMTIDQQFESIVAVPQYNP